MISGQAFKGLAAGFPGIPEASFPEALVAPPCVVEAGKSAGEKPA